METSSIVIYDSLHASGLCGLIVQSPTLQEATDAYFQYLQLLFSAVLITPPSVQTGSIDQWEKEEASFLPFFDSNSTEVQEE